MNFKKGDLIRLTDCMSPLTVGWRLTSKVFRNIRGEWVANAISVSPVDGSEVRSHGRRVYNLDDDTLWSYWEDDFTRWVREVREQHEVQEG